VGLLAQPARLGSTHFLFFLKEVIFRLIIVNNDSLSLHQNLMILSSLFNQEMTKNKENEF
jgi:hypothetical protein